MWTSISLIYSRLVSCYLIANIISLMYDNVCEDGVLDVAALTKQPLLCSNTTSGQNRNLVMVQILQMLTSRSILHIITFRNLCSYIGRIPILVGSCYAFVIPVAVVCKDLYVQMVWSTWTQIVFCFGNEAVRNWRVPELFHAAPLCTLASHTKCNQLLAIWADGTWEEPGMKFIIVSQLQNL